VHMAPVACCAVLCLLSTVPRCADGCSGPAGAASALLLLSRAGFRGGRTRLLAPAGTAQRTARRQTCRGAAAFKSGRCWLAAYSPTLRLYFSDRRRRDAGSRLAAFYLPSPAAPARTWTGFSRGAPAYLLPAASPPSFPRAGAFWRQMGLRKRAQVACACRCGAARRVLLPAVLSSVYR